MTTISNIISNIPFVFYLEVSELRMIQVWINVQGRSNYQQGFKFVKGRAYVASEAQAPDLQKCLQVKQNGESDLGDKILKNSFGF